MITINESGMTFGPFEESCVFKIESSQLYQNVQKNEVKTVEFVLKESGQLRFVEAKSSSPKPNQGNGEKFETFIDEIYRKFLHSINLFYAGILGQHESNNDIPDNMKIAETVSIKFILVIKGHEIDWLPPIAEALNRKMKPILSIWNSQIAVFNDKMTKRYGLTDRDLDS